jgi:peptide-methionine (S)-S-oxide reductase
VISVECGYTGGSKKNPTYHGMKDHTEAVRIVFNPKKIPLVDVLDRFWESHSPFSGKSSCQYRACVWYTDDEQKKAVEASRDALLKQKKKKPEQLSTGIEKAGEFYRAEEYHQKYYKKHRY